MASSTSAAALVDQIRAELAPIDRKLASHPFISALARGEVPLRRWRGSPVSSIGPCPATGAASPTSRLDMPTPPPASSF